MFSGTSVFNKRRSVNSASNLKEFARVNGERITARKKETFNIALSMQTKGNSDNDETLIKRAERSLKCASFRYIAVVNGQAQTLFTHRCRGRHCQECQRIKAYVWQEKIKSIFPNLSENHLNAKYLFSTFTIKNPKIKNLRLALSVMNKAANRMFKMEKYKKFILGGVRSTEITRGKSGADECHPHFHFLLMVKGDYFKKHYVKQEDWAKDWGDCLAFESAKVGYPYDAADYPNGTPRVEVVRAMDKDRKADITNKNIQETGQEIINYVLKYSVKGSDILDHKKGANDGWFFEFDKQIKGCRMITPVGVFKKYLSEIKKEPFSYDEELQKLNEKVIIDPDFEVNKAVYKKGDYLLENRKDRIEYAFEALEQKAYSYQQFYLSIYYDYLKMHNELEDKISAIENSIDYDDELKLVNLLGMQIDRENRMNKVILSLHRTGYLNEENGVYYDSEGNIWSLFATQEMNIELINVTDENDIFDGELL